MGCIAANPNKSSPKGSGGQTLGRVAQITAPAKAHGRRLDCDKKRAAEPAAGSLKKNRYGDFFPQVLLNRVGDFWSVRVGLQYRALVISEDDGISWFWIGSHADYDQLLR